MTTTTVCKLYRLFDEEKVLWFDVYEAPGIEGRQITAEVPRENTAPRAVSAALISKGAEVGAVADTVALAAAIETEAPVVRRAARTGWRDDDQVFVSHRFVAPEAAESTVLSPHIPLVGSAGQLRVCGTLAGWRDLVGVARHSTVMMLALCATFAAPLIALLHRPSFALVLFGPSKVGKSFTQLVAASAMGFGSEKELPTLNATPAGLLAAGLAFDGHMLPINEVGTAQGKKRDIYDVLRETTYRFLSGQDTMAPSLVDGRRRRGEHVRGDRLAVLGDRARCVGGAQRGDARRRRDGAPDRGAGTGSGLRDDLRPAPVEPVRRRAGGVGERAVQAPAPGAA